MRYRLAIGCAICTFGYLLPGGTIPVLKATTAAVAVLLGLLAIIVTIEGRWRRSGQPDGDQMSKRERMPTSTLGALAAGLATFAFLFSQHPVTHGFFGGMTVAAVLMTLAAAIQGD